MSRASGKEAAALRQLAAAYGVQTVYQDALGRRRYASVEATLQVLQALGAELEGLRDVSTALRAREEALWGQMLEPVTVLPAERRGHVMIRLPRSAARGSATLHLLLEDGRTRGWSLSLAEAPSLDGPTIGRTPYVRKRLSVPERVPLGYHRLVVRVGRRRAVSHVVVAPRRAYLDSAGPQKLWGVFAPLYAMRNARNWGVGDYTDLGELARWTHELGGHVVGTLPLLPTFLGPQHYEPSPYAPVSRLLWNELYVDVENVPEFSESPTLRRRRENAEMREALRVAGEADLVDYAAVAAIKRSFLAAMSQSFFAGEAHGPRRDAFNAFLQHRPWVREYAAFRAVMERQGTSWRSWPKRLRDTKPRAEDFDPAVRDYYAYAQWLAHEQLETARGGGNAGLYLDLPLGVHPDGFDAWREQEVFANGVAVGAPPDDFFTSGQDWGFAPLHPEIQRVRGYRYMRACLQHHFRVAKHLRVDHVMGLTRLFWVPAGLTPTEGVYVRYPAHEQYAVLALESHRAGAEIVGEDLGTVPREVRDSMGKHQIQRMYVAQFEAQPDARRALRKPESLCLASLNTHDMPPFAAFWKGSDIDDRIDLGLLDAAAAATERARRDRQRRALQAFLGKRSLLGQGKGAQAVVRGVLRFLARSPARMVLVSLEDLWLEERPQNTPGTWRERPNWQRKMARTWAQIRRSKAIRATLGQINRDRKAPRR